VCKVEVATLRSYPVSKELTWMCPEKHLSSVSLQTVQDQVNGWFNMLTPEEKAEREAKKLAVYERQQASAAAYESREAIKKANREAQAKADYKARTHGPVYSRNGKMLTVAPKPKDVNGTLEDL
jgi:hypothetical protein